MAAAIQNLAKQKRVLLSLEDELQSGLDEYDALLGGKSVNVGMMQIYNDFLTGNAIRSRCENCRAQRR